MSDLFDTIIIGGGPAAAGAAIYAARKKMKVMLIGQLEGELADFRTSIYLCSHLYD